MQKVQHSVKQAVYILRFDAQADSGFDHKCWNIQFVQVVTERGFKHSSHGMNPNDIGVSL